MKELTYSEKLKSPKWQKKRLEIMHRDKFTCNKCGDTETQLHVHHKEYENGCDPWNYDNMDLVTLCEDCHNVIEKLKKSEPDVDFKDIKIYKSNEWTDGSKVMFISIPGKSIMQIYDSLNKYINGYIFPGYMIKHIIAIFKKSINGKKVD